MDSETRICQNCHNEFVIEPDDFAFYEKIKVPPPTFCPQCRTQRRMLHLNMRIFYKRNCDLCGKNAISLFPQSSKFTVYCSSCWWSDKWDPLQYGQPVDFSRPFLEQFKELLERVPVFGPQYMHPTMVNSEYVNIASYLKNCYLLLNSDYSEDCAYSTYLEHSKNVFDVYMGDECELCYEGVNLRKCHRVLFSVDCIECMEVMFSRNLRGCSNCIGCVNLRNKKYHIFNKSFTKEKYFEEIKKYNFGSFALSTKFADDLREFNLRFPKKFMEGTKNSNVSGDYIFNSKNTRLCYEIVGGEDIKYCQFLFLAPIKDSYDVTMWGENLTRGYDSMGIGYGESNVKFSFDCWAEAMNLTYCYHTLHQNTNLFGCSALRHKQFCILNKQYTKEEYEKLVPKIIEHMNDMPYVDKRGRVYKYGEFFPSELSLFRYNETVAQEYFPLTKQQAMESGYRWKDPEERTYKIDMSSENLPDHIKDVGDDIIGKVIKCAHKGECNQQCTTAFKVVKEELQFYKKMSLPLPRLCPNCRHYERLKQRNPLKLWHRQCMCDKLNHGHAGRCANEFETSYAPDRPEIIYCESCYNSEVA